VTIDPNVPSSVRRSSWILNTQKSEEDRKFSWQKRKISSVNLVDVKFSGYTLIVVDDDEIVRKSTIRILRKVAECNGLKINFIESSDGIETLYHLYHCLTRAIKITGIVSDQTMGFWEGTKTAKALLDLYNEKSIPYIPFFILTAYENYKVDGLPIDHIFCKPLNNNNAEDLLSMIKKKN